MRRTEREITDLNKIKEIIENNQCCRLGFIDHGSVYIVPLNYGYIYNNKHSCCKSWKEPWFNDQKVSNVAVMKLIVDTLTCIKIKNRTMCGFTYYKSTP